MNGPDTTNLILTVLAITGATQLVVLLVVTAWAVRQVARVRDIADRIESTYLPVMIEHAHAAIAHLHTIADRSDRVGEQVEGTARRAQTILEVVEPRVARTARGVDTALDLVSGGFTQALAVSAGLRAGLLAVLNGRRHEPAHGPCDRQAEVTGSYEPAPVASPRAR